MSSENGRAYALTVLSPIRAGGGAQGSFASVTRARLEALPLHEASPMARVPNTYFARFFVLDDVPYQGHPARQEHLSSSYLVFCASLHGGPDPYMVDLWDCARETVRELWEFCVGFEGVDSALGFLAYIKRCETESAFFFNGSSDEPLEEQLKALYLKQEFSRFVFEQQGSEGQALQRAFAVFAERTRPWQLEPRWLPGSLLGRSTDAPRAGRAQ
jgi:hypothetical protein